MGSFDTLGKIFNLNRKLDNRLAARIFKNLRKVLVFGVGVIGAYLTHALAEAGNKVTAEMGLRVQYDPFDACTDANSHRRQRELGRSDLTGHCLR